MRNTLAGRETVIAAAHSCRKTRSYHIDDRRNSRAVHNVSSWAYPRSIPWMLLCHDRDKLSFDTICVVSGSCNGGKESGQQFWCQRMGGTNVTVLRWLRFWRFRAGSQFHGRPGDDLIAFFGIPCYHIFKKIWGRVFSLKHSLIRSSFIGLRVLHLTSHSWQQSYKMLNSRPSPSVLFCTSCTLLMHLCWAVMLVHK